MTTRRNFIRHTLGMLSTTALFPLSSYTPVRYKGKDQLAIGHGEFKYIVRHDWGNLDSSITPVQNCHEMVQDRKGRLILLTDETRNNIIIYDRSGKLLKTWGHEFPGGHGLTIWSEDDCEYLFLADTKLGKVVKLTLDGKPVLTLDNPYSLGIYSKEQPYKPTETTVSKNGDIYVADGYGSQYIIQYNYKGEYIRHFGGKGDEDHQFDTCHGVCVDYRIADQPVLICTSRSHNSFKRFSLEGEYLSTLFLPGAFVCRPVIDGENIYAGVCWSRLKYLNRTPNSGFVTILDKDNKVVSNPGGTAPVYSDGSLQLMVQDQPIFKHCHDVCVDNDKNLYVCQWNANQVYPTLLERI